MVSLWHWKPVWAGLLRAAAILAGGMALTIVLLWRLSGPVYFLSPWIIVLLGAAAFFGGYRAARLARRRGWLQGLIVGMLLALFFMTLWSSTGAYSLTIAGADALMLMMLGAAGGVLGVQSTGRTNRVLTGR
ncbi:TIGR04086 family membrane protein [Heliobacterium undosum]|uniref:TIGR04086 family membrane protein n=1 Tax=Heliomicrobium undosum TaxID=121734 RepID=A0A845L0X0_9FIRM|nr:TIGR04086 family membrane protein [Heliomicrobium undosum]MZP30172.1 TIGR04086 family membrane protein [Heliomicrobium undosum]